jgi:hypothetical protein
MIRWYDYLVILMTADWLTAFIFATLAGQIGGIFFVPIVIVFWASYEGLRKDIENAERSE